MSCAGGCIGRSADDQIDEVAKRWVNVSRAFSGEREEDISRVFMLFRVVCELGVVGNLSSLRMARLVTGTGGGEDEVTKHRAVWFVEKSNQYIRAFAGSDFWA